MDPIAIISLISKGVHLVHDVLRPTNKANLIDKVNFKDYIDMKRADKTSSSLAVFLSEKGVCDIKELNLLRQSFVDQLLSNHGIASFIGDQKEEIYLQCENGTNYYLVNGLGNKLNLTQNPSLRDLSFRINQLMQLEQFSRSLPGASLKDLSNMLATSPAINNFVKIA